MTQQAAIAGIDPERVGAWLAHNVPGLTAPVDYALITGGRSNLTYVVTGADGRRFALRRPPTGGVLSTAHDMDREWRFLTALAPTDVPVPRPLAFCADEQLTGGQFYVMEFVDGVVLGDADTASELTLDARHHAGQCVVDALVTLHAVDPAAAGLSDTIRTEGYLERQLRRWHRQAHRSDAPYLGLLDEVHTLLAARVPAQTTGIVHGDYRPGNMSLGPDGRVLAIFDWELATTGDPLADLSWLIASWQEPDDTVPATTATPSTAPGFPPRSELIERYATRSGRDVSDLPYWLAFSRWRSACIKAGVAARYQAGVMGDDGFAEHIQEQNEQASRLLEAALGALLKD